MESAATCAAGAGWAAADELCIRCGRGDWAQAGFGPRTLLICSACQARGSHVGCEGAARGRELTEDEVAAAPWFCSQACAKVHERSLGLVGARLPLAGSQLSLQFVRYDAEDKGSVQAVEATIRLLERSFEAGELLRRVCMSSCHEGDTEEDDSYDYSSFFLVLLRQGPTLVCAGALRIWGPRFAELPFVITREGHRRCGYLRRLLIAVESALRSLGVGVLVAPCLASLLDMWSHRLGFRLADAAERRALEGQILMMDADTCHLMKKDICAPPPPPAQSGAAAAVPAASQCSHQVMQASGSLSQQPTSRAPSAADPAYTPSCKAAASAEAAPEPSTAAAEASEDAPAPRLTRSKRTAEAVAGPAPRPKRVRKPLGKKAQQAAAGQGQGQGQAVQAPAQQVAPSAYAQLYQRWQSSLGKAAATPLLQNAVRVARGDALAADLLRAAASLAVSRQATVAQLQLQSQLLRTQQELEEARQRLATAEAENARLRAAAAPAMAAAAQPDASLQPEASAQEPEVQPATGQAAVTSHSNALVVWQAGLGRDPTPSLSSPPARSPRVPAAAPATSAGIGDWLAQLQPAGGAGQLAAETGGTGLSLLVAQYVPVPAASPQSGRSMPAAQSAAASGSGLQSGGALEAGGSQQAEDEQDAAMEAAAQFAWPE